MLTYSFSEIGSMSLYEYLYQCIKNDIVSGALAPGDRLPSKRSFSRHLNVSAITVENAYGQLLAEGYIYSIPKKATMPQIFPPAFQGPPFLLPLRQSLWKTRRKSPALPILPAARPIRILFHFLSGPKSCGR